MNTDILVRGRLLDSPRVLDIVVKDGRVVRVKKAGAAAADFGGAETIIGPTLFDIQVNGAGGHDLQGTGMRVEDVRAIHQYLRARGVSCWIPTLVTGPLDAMEHNCRTLWEALQERALQRAVPGLHLEGPYISPQDGARGAHPREHVRPPSTREFMRLHKAAGGRVSYTTLAPELPRVLPFIQRITREGVLVSLGHHLATRAQITAAVDAGASLCTHLGNGAPAQIHRHHNPLWPQLAEDRLHASLIADLHHLPVDTMKVFVRAKSPERIILTSDCVNLAGLPPGAYEFAGAQVELRRDGKICLLGTDLLAGSSLMLLQGVVNVWRSGVMTLEQAFASASVIPGRLFRLRKRFRLPQAGDRADFIAFEADAKGAARTTAVFVEGELVQE